MPMRRDHVSSARSVAQRSAAGAAVVARMAVALVTAIALPAGAVAATIEVTAERHGELIEIEAKALLKADAATAWRVLTDYDRYAEFEPDLRSSHVVAREGRTVRVEQSGDARLWLLRMPLDMTFEITESPPYSLKSRAVGGSMQGLQSRYTIVPAASGIYLEYTGHVVPGFELFGSIEQYAVQQNVTRQFQALVDEIEHSNGNAGAPSVAGAR